MSKMIRGKVIVEKKSETPVLPEETSASFATPEAPWVGAESAWRHGIVPPPHEAASRYPRRVDEALSTQALSFELSDDELETVLSSFPAAPPVERRETLGVVRFAGYMAVAGIVGVVTWGVVGGKESPETADSEVHPPVVAPMAHTSECSDDTTEQDVLSLTSDVCSVETVSFALDEDALMAAGSEAVTISEPAAVSEKPTKKPTVRIGKSRGKKRYVTAETAAVAPSEAPARKASLSDADETFADAAIGSMAAALRMTEAEKTTVSEQSSPAADMVLSNSEEEAAEQGLSDAQIARVMESIAPEVRKCGGRVSGRVVVAIEVLGTTGRVINAKTIDRDEVGANEGFCAARAVRLAKFPSFEKNRLSVTYAFDL